MIAHNVIAKSFEFRVFLTLLVYSFARHEHGRVAKVQMSKLSGVEVLINTG